MASTRRRFLRTAGSGLASLGLAGCAPESEAHSAELLEALRQRLGLTPAAATGGYVGQAFERGHRLRTGNKDLKPDETRSIGIAIIGSGIAGLAAAGALRRGGIDDYRIFELEDEAGGNSRGGQVAGFDCPWGAHYLPLPGPAAEDVAELLTELKLRHVVDGQPRYDERQLCHAPEERLFLPGKGQGRGQGRDLGIWQDGLLPILDQSAATLAQYRRFAALVAAETAPGRYTVPTSASRFDERLAALDAETFSAWLDRHALDALPLRWYLDYCCRDDYGASSRFVSAWAGLHYFISRHGFTGPDEPTPAQAAADQVLTWPEGNAWLARRLAEPHREQIVNGALVLGISESAEAVAVDVLDVQTQRITRWQARQAIVATPLFIAARLIANPSAALQTAATQLPHAPWLVANLHLDGPLRQRHGQPPMSWDNVVYGSDGLGYVNAMNQSTRPHDGPTVLSYYRAFGDDPGAGRRELLARDWTHWREAIVADLAIAHPDLKDRLREVRIMRYGHAMAIPAPGMRSAPWLAALRHAAGRIHHAHSDLSSYSVFEEAYDQGLYAGRQAVKAAAGR
ncbi:NAD(P)-binding protein [Nevskia ramosa]|uniref:NAD(P)-binding protein n=1 Tax=Nevskia ramosa TaxID=64002 RepID=UPI003D0B66D1